MKKQVDILLVEDNSTDAELTIRVLEKNNLANNLLHLKDGAEALDFLYCKGNYSDERMNHRLKLILLDLKMPKVSGIEVLRKIKSEQCLISIPVVVLTSSKEDQDIEQCYRLGANSYIVKPVEFDHFVNTIANMGLYWNRLNQLPDKENVRIWRNQ